MKSIIRKELRENLAVTVFGLLVFSLLLGLEYRSYESLIKNVALGGNEQRSEMQPLASGSFASYTGFFCGLFAALLGWLQAYRERHRDLWSFLVHRPMSRTKIFYAKVVAGLSLYVVAAGAPLVVFIGWAATPGHVAAPFEWAMLWPVLIFFLAGISAYFAGMLTCLRQARWYASRGLPIGMALAATFAGAGLARVGQGLLVILLAAVLLLVVTWAAFKTNGYYRGQARAGTLVLPMVLSFGVIPVIFLGLALLTVVLPQQLANENSWSAYQMTKDGTVAKLTWRNGQAMSLVDVDGQAIKDPKTGQPVKPSVAQFAPYLAFGAYLYVGAQNEYSPNIDVSRLATLFKVNANTLWFYWVRYGRLVAYDAASRRFIGSLGPDGFRPDQPDGGERFGYPPSRYVRFGETLHTATALYKLDLDHHSCEAIFHSEPGDPIFDASVLFTSSESEGREYVVVTRTRVLVLAHDGQTIWESPYESGYLGRTQIRVWKLSSPGSFSLWVTPARAPQWGQPNNEPTRVTWLTDGHVTKSMELPDLQTGRHGPGLEEKYTGLMLQPIVVGLTPVFVRASWPGGYWWYWRLAGLGLIVSIVICVPLGLWLSRKYSYSVKASVAWAVFLLFTGIPGLLAFLSVQEWPAHETCPQCGRKRIVERARCEHCGATFPPPEKLGIEIFEPAQPVGLGTEVASAQGRI